MEEGSAPTTGGALPVRRAAGPFRAGATRELALAGAICPFLIRETADGGREPAGGSTDPAHRCVALDEPVPQSARQQELVCLAAAHVNCPRYLRGVLNPKLAPPPVRREAISAPVIGATLVLAAAIAVSLGFLAVRGGFELRLASPSPGPVAATSPGLTPASTDVGTTAPSGPAMPTVAATPTAASPSAGPLPSAPPSPSATPGPTPAATPSATPPSTPTPAATSDRFALLTACPDTPDCWIYVIRAGDNLRSIGNYFGVSYDRILAMNPSITDPTNIHAGQKIRIPTPTR